jgi:preprotein translocase subunit SecA
VQIPNNFNEFIEKQIPKWADNILVAYHFQENINYIIQDGVIKPVDFFSTGIVQNSTNWSDGLHQFLQVKH